MIALGLGAVMNVAVSFAKSTMEQYHAQVVILQDASLVWLGAAMIVLNAPIASANS